MKKPDEIKQDNTKISSDIKKNQNSSEQKDKSSSNESKSKIDNKHHEVSNKTTVENNNIVKESKQDKSKETIEHNAEMSAIDKSTNETNIDKQPPPALKQPVNEAEKLQSNPPNDNQTTISTTNNNNINKQETPTNVTSVLKPNIQKDVINELQEKHLANQIKSSPTLSPNNVQRQMIQGNPTKTMSIHDRNQQFNQNIGIPSSQKRNNLLRNNSKEKK